MTGIFQKISLKQLGLTSCSSVAGTIERQKREIFGGSNLLLSSPPPASLPSSGWALAAAAASKQSFTPTLATHMNLYKMDMNYSTKFKLLGLKHIIWNDFYLEESQTMTNFPFCPLAVTTPAASALPCLDELKQLTCCLQAIFYSCTWFSTTWRWITLCEVWGLGFESDWEVIW